MIIFNSNQGSFKIVGENENKKMYLGYQQSEDGKKYAPNHFWNRWRNEKVTLLREVQRVKLNNKIVDMIL